jgi:hypothetical protein
MADPALANLAQVSREQFGAACCGGDVEKAMRRVIGHRLADDRAPRCGHTRKNGPPLAR